MIKISLLIDKLKLLEEKDKEIINKLNYLEEENKKLKNNENKNYIFNGKPSKITISKEELNFFKRNNTK